MQCVRHGEREAVDVCRSCGKPICAPCATAPDGLSQCETCRPPAVAAPSAPPPPAAHAPTPARSPLRAALLSVFLPGLGQAYNGEPLKGLAFLAVAALLIYGTNLSPSLGPFIGALWLYQLVEAFSTAIRSNRPASTPGAEPERGESPLVSYAMVALGGLLLFENLTGLVFRHAQVLVPALVIAAGLYLLLSYFRTGEGARA